MNNRMDYYTIAPEGLGAMMEMEKYTKTTGMNKKLRELIKIRVSQINGCAYCLNMHSADARKLGESEQRIYCVSAWRECSFYSEAEQVALELAEAITKIADQAVSTELYEKVRQHYDEKAYVDLVLTINQINSWNRLSIAMGNQAE